MSINNAEIFVYELLDVVGEGASQQRERTSQQGEGASQQREGDEQ